MTEAELALWISGASFLAAAVSAIYAWKTAVYTEGQLAEMKRQNDFAEDQRLKP